LGVDWSQRPEFAALKPHVVLWRERFTPQGHADYVQAEHPYLGPAFEFLERQPGAAPWVARVHCFNFAATMSHGQISGDVPGISIGAARVANGVASALLAEDYEKIRQRMVGWSNPELRGDEYTLSEDVTPFLADQQVGAK
ncbi:MAG: FAD-dependent urate hydroxylase, partial [Hyphomicrobiales bacterium]|nr:FAD-dependent urate hydroxylase [Hyphomicrobiales bacterium]